MASTSPSYEEILTTLTLTQLYREQNIFAGRRDAWEQDNLRRGSRDGDRQIALCTALLAKIQKEIDQRYEKSRTPEL
jgi:hypothetical protein